MILQTLVKYYEDLRKQEKIPSSGWGQTRVVFGLNLGENGEVLSLLPLKVAKQRGKKTVYEAREFEVPQPVKRSVDIAPNFLCDNSTYVFGIDEKGKQDRSRKCFYAFRDFHVKMFQKVQGAVARAVVLFLENWEPEQAEQCTWFSENRKELMAGGNILFFYKGEPVTKEVSIRECWQEYYNSLNGIKDGLCMVTGQKAHIIAVHPIIKGVYGAQAMGTSLVSFNAPAFCSYGKEQGKNASVGEYAAMAYGAALNYLLNDREHTRTIGDTTVVCWVEGGEEIYQDVSVAAMFGAEEEGGITDQELSAIFDAIKKGNPIELKEKMLETDKRFYILGVAPNAARLSIRFFWQDSFGSMLKNISCHYERLEIVKPAFDNVEKLPIRRLLWETINQNAKDKSASPQMAADTLKSILTGGRYPASLLNGVMLRICAEKKVTRGRAAILKAYYLNNEHTQCPREVLQMELNEQSTNVPYMLGRLFAVLEHIQQEANPGINATIKDKYFNSAAATPAQIFPLLLNLSQKHLRKLKDEGSRITFNRRMQEIMEDMGQEFPARMTLPQQGSFYLGYYHQTQKRYQKKEEK